MKMNMEEAKAGDSVKHSGHHENNQLKTDRPLSEKDDVKNAEKRTRKALKDHL